MPPATRLLRTAALLLMAAALGCDDQALERCSQLLSPTADAALNHATLQTALSDARAGTVLCLDAGNWPLTDELALTNPGVELRGPAAAEARLDFAGQARGANGLTVTNGDGFVITHLTVANTAGDAVRVSRTDGVIFRDVRVRWDAGPSNHNGGYGLYPTECTHVTIEGCSVQGASDAGVYVGQSQQIIVRGNEVYGNVAGIEIENSLDAEVYENDSHDNTAGLLVFALPNLPRKNCERVLVHDNHLHHNNQASFAAPGSIVAGVPAGTGMFLLAADHVEVRDNLIDHNSSIGLGLFSFQLAMSDSYLQDPAYDPFSEGNYLHDNRLEQNGNDPLEVAATLLAVVTPGGASAEQILWDGETKGGERNCLFNNHASFRNLDYGNGFAHSTTDDAPLTCEGSTVEPQPRSYPPPVLPPQPTFVPRPRLSDYAFFVGAPAQQVPAQGVIPYDVNASLFADGARKRRFVVLPPGGSIGFDADALWQFPDGTTLIKSFSFDSPGGEKMVETRLEVLSQGIWTLHTYLYDASQSDAVRQVPGATVRVTRSDGSQFDYRVPSAEQCKTCHLSGRTALPLGTRTRQLNLDQAGDNQLTRLQRLGALPASVPAPATLPHLVDPFGSADLESRARSYLDANCAHCHSAGGAAGSSSLRLAVETTKLIDLGVCRVPNAAGPGSGNLLWDVVPGKPDESVLIYRVRATDPNTKMPPLPSVTSDGDGARLLAEWIGAMPAQVCQ